MNETDELSTINIVIHEHEVIYASVNSVRNSNEDLARTFDEAQKSGWIQHNIFLLSDKLQLIKDKLTDLEAGFRLHYQLDEDALPSVVGDLMLRAIKIDHKEMLRQFDEIHILLTGMSAPKIKESGTIVVKKVDTLCQTIETHIRREASMLQLLSKAFQATI
jgi:hypothetical protein